MPDGVGRGVHTLPQRPCAAARVGKGKADVIAKKKEAGPEEAEEPPPRTFRLKVNDHMTGKGELP